jgi:hypothetical protein
MERLKRYMEIYLRILVRNTKMAVTEELRTNLE